MRTARDVRQKKLRKGAEQGDFPNPFQPDHPVNHGQPHYKNHSNRIMKTTLTPPPITPGPWTADPYSFMVLAPPSGRSSDALGKDTKLVQVMIADCESRPCGPDESKANAKFIAASSAMAEALAAWLEYFHAPPGAEVQCPYEKAKAALLSAGYTITTEV